MASNNKKAEELEQGLLEIGEEIDNCDQSRTALSDGMDRIREKIAELYGEDFENDLLEHMGYFVEDEEDVDLDEEDD